MIDFPIAGSNIIHNLRDAIIAAEAVFGDVFKNFIHVARKFHTVHQVFDAAVEENCVFKCPGGKNSIVPLLQLYTLLFQFNDFFFHQSNKWTDVAPKPNRYYQPSSNGCGSLGLNINTEYLPAIEMENCCNAHDICYDTCNKGTRLALGHT